jgi:DNA-binding MarR family transcriptional regulator
MGSVPSLLILTDIVPVVLLSATIITAFLAVRGFKQSRQALSESAALISVVVGALTSRIETSENLILQLRSDVDSINRRDIDLQKNTSERTEYVNLLNYLQELLTYDKRFVIELTKFKTRLETIQQTQQDIVSKPRLVLNGNSMMESLTPTEIQVIQMLSQEGPKAAPELGKRLNKSREHTARLMKKLYLEGYIDRETNHTPFRYRLSEKVRSTLKAGNETESIAAAQSEKT